MLKVKNGDLRRMDLLFKRYRDPLFAFAYRMTAQREASEDVVQNVFYRIIRSRHTFTGHGEFRTWVFHLARNVLKDHYKRSVRLSYIDISLQDRKADDRYDADSELEKKEELAILQNALLQLDADDREIIILSRFHEMKYHQVAEIMDMTVGAIKTRMHRAMQQLISLKNNYQ